MPVKPKTLSKKPPTTLRVAARPKVEYELWYSQSRWLALREQKLQANPLCESCAPLVAEATQVDHIKPHRGNEQLMWSYANLQSLCHSCHSRKTFEETIGGTSTLLYPKDLPLPTKPLIVVCGPPGAGKTTYARKHAKPTDLILDVNEDDASDFRRLVERLRVRNALLRDFVLNSTPHTACYLVSECGSYKARFYWKSKGAIVVPVHPGTDACLERVGFDPRLAQSIRKWS